jgi:hypothetical protein
MKSLSFSKLGLYANRIHQRNTNDFSYMILRYIHTLCHEYLDTNRKYVTATTSATHGTVTQVTQRADNLGHKLFVNIFFS